MLENPKHERFARELAQGASASAAYATAGYNPHRSNAAGLARKEHIQARVADILAQSAQQRAEATEKAAEALAIDRQWVMARLVENVDRAMQAVEVKSPQGTGTGEYKYDGAVANRALELLGKELGMFIDRSESVNIVHDVSSEPMSDEAWEAKHGAAATSH